ncbi:MAG: hypothetical protein HYY02_13335 [Chloroflexi bacterium]|nr:hypothetical protein [Chloroflexota bacterium]
MTAKKEKIKGSIPEFKSIEEEAEFWDTHDTTDYEDEFKPVKVRFAKNLTAGLTLRFDHETMAKLKKLAGEKKIPVASLVHLWVRERLAEPEGRSASTKKS